MTQNLFDSLNIILSDFLLYFLPIFIAIVFLIFSFQSNPFEKGLEKVISNTVNKNKDDSTNIQELLDESLRIQLYFMNKSNSLNTKVLMVGIFLIITGVVILISGLTIKTDTEKISSGAVIGGLVTQFIGGTIIVLFRLVFKQTYEYHLSLEKLTAIQVALKLMNRLPSNDQGNLIPQLIDTILNHQLSKHGPHSEPKSKAHE
jgi:hypothetical protein